ncbi:RNase adapter RapZ [Maribacter aurantiacus]|uniref:ATP-binding protein n=1 Tax=Maribacter aurantiacus TaxID=1882343 RepID=A0A5R8M5K8_9FLAO|nr:ATP-binding protein [Maribacter aurantiacus]TLF44847.1 ATP-binding protein [Maribacter aurantiacus]
MDFKRIVITGAPGTGKTSVIKSLEDSGYYCFHEIIRTMTLEAKKSQRSDSVLSNPIEFVDDSLAFNHTLLKGRLAQFQEAGNLKNDVLFYDRGTPDVLAYMDYFGQAYDVEFKEICKQYRYDQVFILPPWEEIYVQDNERLESYSQAVDLHIHLEETYRSLGYDIEEVPFGTVAERLNYIVKRIII